MNVDNFLAEKFEIYGAKILWAERQILRCEVWGKFSDLRQRGWKWKIEWVCGVTSISVFARKNRFFAINTPIFWRKIVILRQPKILYLCGFQAFLVRFAVYFYRVINASSSESQITWDGTYRYWCETQNLLKSVNRFESWKLNRGKP